MDPIDKPILGLKLVRRDGPAPAWLADVGLTDLQRQYNDLAHQIIKRHAELRGANPEAYRHPGPRVFARIEATSPDPTLRELCARRSALLGRMRAEAGLPPDFQS